MPLGSKPVRSCFVALMLIGPLGCSKHETKPEPEAEAVEKEEPAAVQDKPKPAQRDIRTEEVSYQVGDTTLKGSLSWDANIKDPRPGILVVHEWWGLNDYVRKRARMLAEAGYTALALDMYGDGKEAKHPDDAMKFMQAAISDRDVAKQRFLAAYELLAEHPSSKPSDISAIGYCFGGAVVLDMARQGVDLDGVVSFHGSLGTPSPARKGQVKSKVLVLHGADDQLVPPEQVAAFEKEMDAAGVDYELIAYPGAKHAFTNPAATENGKKFGLPLAYDADADAKSWAEMSAFFEELYPAH